jgi:hypothetical protein
VTQWVKFEELMQSPEVTEVAEEFFSLGDPSWPPFISRFLALTMLCSVAEPDSDMSGGVVGDGCCVFYVEEREWDPAVGKFGPSGRWEPWACTFRIGGSVSFNFGQVNHSGEDLYEDDCWRVPSMDLGWQQATLDLLSRSLWRVLQTPAQIYAQRALEDAQSTARAVAAKGRAAGA